MKKQIRLLSLLLVLVMLFCSCQNVTTPETTTATPTAEPTEAPSEAPSDEPSEEPSEEPTEETYSEFTYPDTLETVAPEDQITYSRDENTLTRDDVLAMYTLTQEDYDNAIDLLYAFRDLGLTSDNYDEVDAKYYEFEDAFYHLSNGGI